MNNRERILEKIKTNREKKKLDIDSIEAPLASGLKVPEGDLSFAFKKSIETVQGECVIAMNREDCFRLLQEYINTNTDKKNVVLSPSLLDSPFVSLQTENCDDISKISVGITSCELLSAQTGTILMTSREGRRIIGLSPIHIVIAQRSQIRRTLDESIKELSQKYDKTFPSQITLITGPSRTADIEKTLILGAHGPKRLCVFIY